MSWRQSRHDVGFAMIRAKLGCHGGKAAMMWASPTRHPGSARMIKFEALARFKNKFFFLIREKSSQLNYYTRKNFGLKISTKHSAACKKSFFASALVFQT
jgi:hypothetical protein